MHSFNPIQVLSSTFYALKSFLTLSINANIFLKFDCKLCCYGSRVVEHDMHKTIFTMLESHYEWLVMSFGLKNALTSF